MLLERDLPKLSISSFPVYSSSQPTLNCSQYKNDNKTYIYLANFENTKTRSSEYSFEPYTPSHPSNISTIERRSPSK